MAVDAALLRRLGEVCAQVTDDQWARPRPGATGGRWPSVGRPTARCPRARRSWPGPPIPPRCRLCSPSATDARVPVTAAGGRSGVCGASVPLFGGVALDVCGLAGIAGVDADSLVADLRAGTFGPDVEGGLRRGHGLTLGHWPQSMDLSTVGGWLACRGAGQYSNRYGKIEDMVTGLEVVLATGGSSGTGGQPRSSTGPDLTQLFVGSEGNTRGDLSALFRVPPGSPGVKGRRAYGVRHPTTTGWRPAAWSLRRCAAVAPHRQQPTESAPGSIGPGRHQRAHRAGRGRPLDWSTPLWPCGGAA